MALINVHERCENVCHCCFIKCEDGDKMLREIQYYEMFVECFNKQAYYGPSLPSCFTVCEACGVVLRECFTFMRLVTETQKKLYCTLKFNQDPAEKNSSENTKYSKEEREIGPQKILQTRKKSCRKIRAREYNKIKRCNQIEIKKPSDSSLLAEKVMEQNYARRENECVSQPNKTRRTKVKCKRNKNVTDCSVFKNENCSDNEYVNMNNLEASLKSDKYTNDSMDMLQCTGDRLNKSDDDWNDDLDTTLDKEDVQMEFKTDLKINIQDSKKVKILKNVASRNQNDKKEKYRRRRKPFDIKDTDIICPICNTFMFTNRRLVKHMNEHYPKHVCDKCGKTFARSSTYSDHVKGHDRKVNCKYCNKPYTKNALTKHIEVKHLGKKDIHPCNLCDQRFETTYARVNHIEKIHKIFQTFTCNTCDKVFNLYEKYRRHIQIHFAHKQPSAGEIISCDICQKVFPSIARLKVHKSTHNPEKNYQCHMCSRSYKKKYLLTTHIKMHDDSIPKYHCSHCSIKFVLKNYLKSHMKRVHKIDVELSSLVLSKTPSG